MSESPAEGTSASRRSAPLLALTGTLGVLFIGILIALQVYRGPRIRAALACVATGIASLLLIALCVRVRPKFHWVALLFLAFYVSVEHVLAPVVMRPYGMKTYYYTKNPDHLPPFRFVPPGMNSDLARCLWEPEEFRPEGMNLIFIGDSFTHGALLEAEQAFPHLLTQRLRSEFPDADVKGVNLGWVSSSPFLDERRLKLQGAHYNPDLVALFVDMTDFQDDIKWRRRLERRGVYWWIYHFPFAMHAFESLWPDAFEEFYWANNEEVPRKRFFMSEAPLEETRADCAELLDNLDAVDAWCREQGARFVVYVLPRSYQYSDRESPDNWEAAEYELLGPYSHEPFRLMAERAAEVDYPIRSLLEPFQETTVFPTCFDHDPHWNPEGAKVAADAIWTTLREDVEQLLSH